MNDFKIIAGMSFENGHPFETVMIVRFQTQVGLWAEGQETVWFESEDAVSAHLENNQYIQA